LDDMVLVLWQGRLRWCARVLREGDSGWVWGCRPGGLGE